MVLCAIVAPVLVSQLPRVETLDRPLARGRDRIRSSQKKEVSPESRLKNSVHLLFGEKTYPKHHPPEFSLVGIVLAPPFVVALVRMERGPADVHLEDGEQGRTKDEGGRSKQWFEIGHVRTHFRLGLGVALGLNPIIMSLARTQFPPKKIQLFIPQIHVHVITRQKNGQFPK